jgi:DNA mismatch repair protein MutL
LPPPPPQLSRFEQLGELRSFGFRGEALSSLCALCDVAVVTRTAAQEGGTRVEYDRSGGVARTAPAPRAVGTTVALRELFKPLPVRHKEFLRNARREFGKLLACLQAYALACVRVRLVVTHAAGRAPRATVLATPGGEGATPRDALVAVLGAAAAAALQPFSAPLPGGGTASGFVSAPEAGAGRAAGDRQLLYVNGRPVDLPRVARALNDAWRAAHPAALPACVLDLRLPRDAYDVNVTPDKRRVLLHDEEPLLAALRAALAAAFQPPQRSFALAAGGGAGGVGGAGGAKRAKRAKRATAGKAAAAEEAEWSSGAEETDEEAADEAGAGGAGWSGSDGGSDGDASGEEARPARKRARGGTRGRDAAAAPQPAAREAAPSDDAPPAETMPVELPDDDGAAGDAPAALPPAARLEAFRPGRASADAGRPRAGALRVSAGAQTSLQRFMAPAPAPPRGTGGDDGESAGGGGGGDDADALFTPPPAPDAGRLPAAADADAMDADAPDATPVELPDTQLPAAPALPRAAPAAPRGASGTLAFDLQAVRVRACRAAACVALPACADARSRPSAGGARRAPGCCPPRRRRRRAAPRLRRCLAAGGRRRGLGARRRGARARLGRRR